MIQCEIKTLQISVGELTHMNSWWRIDFTFRVAYSVNHLHGFRTYVQISWEKLREL